MKKPATKAAKNPPKKPATPPPPKPVKQRPDPIAALKPLTVVATTRSDAAPGQVAVIPTTVLPPGPYTITATGLEFNDSIMTLQHWQRLMQDLTTSKKRWHTLMADTLSYGRRNYGDSVVDSTLQQLELGLDDVRKSEVLARLPGDILHSKLISTEHAYVIARELPDATPQEQSKWAATAIEHELDPTQLARCIQSGEVLSKEELKEKSGKGTGGILTIQGIVQTFRLWLTNAGGPDALRRLPRAQRTELLTLLTPITDLHTLLTTSK